MSSTGGSIAVQVFAPWLSSRYSQGTMPITYNFTGQHFDSETGLNYGVRYYDPFVEIFLSVDTVRGNGEGLQTGCTAAIIPNFCRVSDVQVAFQYKADC